MTALHQIYEAALDFSVRSIDEQGQSEGYSQVSYHGEMFDFVENAFAGLAARPNWLSDILSEDPSVLATSVDGETLGSHVLRLLSVIIQNRVGEVGDLYLDNKEAEEASRLSR